MFRDVNGQIFVAGFECDEAQFAAIEPAYSGLPAGIIERRYDPDAAGGAPKHVLITADHRQTGGPVPWPEGDAMLAKADRYPALHDAAFPPPDPPPPPTAAERIERAYADDPAYAALVDELAARFGETPLQLRDAMKARQQS